MMGASFEPIQRLLKKKICIGWCECAHVLLVRRQGSMAEGLDSITLFEPGGNGYK